VYGAYKYPRGQMHQLRPGAAVAEAGPMTPDVLASPADGATRRVGPFEMKPAVALKCAGGSLVSCCARSRCLSRLGLSLWLHARAALVALRPCPSLSAQPSRLPSSAHNSRRRACAPAALAMRQRPRGWASSLAPCLRGGA